MTDEVPTDDQQAAPTKRNKFRILINYLIAILVIGIITRIVISQYNSPINHEESDHMALLPCPDSPNCVCSQAVDKIHNVRPYKITPEFLNPIEELATVCKTLPRTRIVFQNENYLHVEFTSALMRYVDDAEFLLDAGENIIEVRSASRIGYSDMGANRARIEKIRKLFDQKVNNHE